MSPSQTEHDKYDEYAVVMEESGLKPRSFDSWLKSYKAKNAKPKKPRKPVKHSAEYVECGHCGRQQKDEGRGATCSDCGASPLPSRAYPIQSVFHPNHKSLNEGAKPIALQPDTKQHATQSQSQRPPRA